jgi:hypothetical protein
MDLDDRACCAASQGRFDESPPPCDEPRAATAPRDTFPGRRTTQRFNAERVTWSEEW